MESLGVPRADRTVEAVFEASEGLLDTHFDV